MQEFNDQMGTKQDVLISSQNIKTINHQSILGEGNIEIQGGSGVEQVQTDWNQTDTQAVDYIKNKAGCKLTISPNIDSKNIQNRQTSVLLLSCGEMQTKGFIKLARTSDEKFFCGVAATSFAEGGLHLYQRYNIVLCPKDKRGPSPGRETRP